MRDPIEEKDMILATANMLAIVFNPEKHIPAFCEQFLPGESLLREGESRGFDRTEMCDYWAEEPHNKIRHGIPCEHALSKHGIIFHAHENHIAQDMREDGVIICPGDLMYLDNEGHVFAVSLPNGEGFRLVSTGRKVPVAIKGMTQAIP